MKVKFYAGNVSVFIDARNVSSVCAMSTEMLYSFASSLYLCSFLVGYNKNPPTNCPYKPSFQIWTQSAGY